MMRTTMLLRLVALLLAAFAAPAAAGAAPVRVAIETEAGVIAIEVDQDRAPLTAANFLRYVDRRLFDGANFYRSMRLAPGSGLIQGGVDFRRTLAPVAHEPTTQTGLSHVDGAVSMARAEPGSARSDFFIILGDTMTGLDAGPNSGGDLLGYAVFGRVVEGMDVVRRIHEAPISATEGEGAMRGQMLAPRIRIVSARRVD